MEGPSTNLTAGEVTLDLFVYASFYAFGENIPKLLLNVLFLLAFIVTLLFVFINSRGFF